MSDQNRELKIVRAKLYNFKSGVEGLLQLVESGVVPADRVPDAIGLLAARFKEDCSSKPSM